MRQISVRLSVAFLFLAALPLGCTSSPGTSTKGSGGSDGSTHSGGAGGGSGGSTSTGNGGSIGTIGGSGGSTETGGGGGTSDATTSSDANGGDATGGMPAGGGGGTSDTTASSSGSGGDATGGMSAGGDEGNSAPDAGTSATGGNGGEEADGGDGTGDGGDDAPPTDDSGEGDAAPSCTDQVHNGSETDVDCGGGTCTKCGSGLMCQIDDDCRNGSCVSGKCADSFAATAPITQSGNRWRITLGTVIFEVDSAVSGKVATFSIDGTDVVAKNMAVTGSVFWTSPQTEWYTNGQTWPPPAEMDTSAYTPNASGNVLTMTGPLGTDKLSISKRYWGNLDHQAVTIEYTIHNGNSAAVSKAPWEITRVYTGGLTFFPNSEPAVKLGDASFGPVPFTSAQGTLWFKYKSTDFTTISSVKGGADGLEGWAAHIACGTGLEGSWAYPTCAKSPILIKEWTDIPAAAAPPTEKEIEIYAQQNSYEEFEQQGAYQVIPAGGTAVWTMHWLLRYLPSTVAPTAGSAALVTWVREQLL